MTTDISTPEAAASEETVADPGAADATKKTDDKDSDYWKREFEKAAARRDSFAKQQRELKEQLEAVQSQLSGFKDKESELEALKRQQADEENARKGDIEALRKSAAAREEELKAHIAKLKSELEGKLSEKDREVNDLRNTYLLKNEVMREIEPIATEGLASTVWLHVSNMFELGEDMKPRPKDSVLDIRTFVTKYLEENGLQPLLRNERAKGMGSDAVKGAETQKATSIPPDFNSWDQGRRKKWMGENPKLALEAAQQALKAIAK